MKTKNCLFTLLLILVGSKSFEQDHKNYFGIKGGISIPNLTTAGGSENPLNSGYSSRTGPDFAFFGETRLTKTFSIMSSLEYSSQGGKKNGFQALATPEEFAAYFPPGQVPAYLYADYKSEAKLNYLMLSLLAKVNWHMSASSPWSFYIDAGPFGALLVSAHQVTNGSSIVYADEQMHQPLTPEAQSFDNKENIRTELHKGNLGIEGDFGFALNFKNNRIFIEGGGNYGFLNIQKGLENGKNHTGAATIRVGYAYNLGKMFKAKTHS